MFNKKRFLDYYDYAFEEYDDLFIFKKSNPSNRKYISKHARREGYFFYDYDCKTIEEAKILYKEGKIEKASGKELYKILGGYTDEELDDLYIGMYKKDREYINYLRDEIGLLKEVLVDEDGEDATNAVDVNEWRVEEHVGRISKYYTDNVDIYKCKNGKYVIKENIFSPPNDYSIHNIYTSQKPSEDFFKRKRFIDNEINRLREGYSKDLKLKRMIKDILENYSRIENVTFENGEIEYDRQGENGLTSTYYMVNFKNGNSYKWHERNIFDLGTVFNPCFEVFKGSKDGIVEKNDNEDYVFKYFFKENGWTDIRKLTTEEIESYKIVKEISRSKNNMKM